MYTIGQTNTALSTTFLRQLSAGFEVDPRVRATVVSTAGRCSGHRTDTLASSRLASESTEPKETCEWCTSARGVTYLKRAHQSVVHGHQAAGIVEFTAVVRCGEQRHQLTLGKELVAVFDDLEEDERRSESRYVSRMVT